MRNILVILHKDQRSANVVRTQLGELSRKIRKYTHPVYTTRKMGSNITPKESKPPIVYQQCVVYQFKCDLGDADYVGYTCRHLYKRMARLSSQYSNNLNIQFIHYISVPYFLFLFCIFLYFAPLFFILLLYFLYLFPLIFIYVFSSSIFYFT